MVIGKPGASPREGLAGSADQAWIEREQAQARAYDASG